MAADSVGGPARREFTRFLNADLTDLGQTYDVLDGADAVIHMAAIAAQRVFPSSQTFFNNVRMTWNVLEAAARLEDQARGAGLERAGELHHHAAQPAAVSVPAARRRPPGHPARRLRAVEAGGRGAGEQLRRALGLERHQLSVSVRRQPPIGLPNCPLPTPSRCTWQWAPTCTWTTPPAPATWPPPPTCRPTATTSCFSRRITLAFGAAVGRVGAQVSPGV